MFFTGLSVALAGIALVCVLIGLRLILRETWFMQWVKGTFAFFLLGLSFLIALVALDLYRYHAIERETTIATVSMQKLDDQMFQLKIAQGDKGEQVFNIEGDLWQMDARLITWSGPFGSLGMQPGYRLDRISGRYLSLEQENSEERTVYELTTTEIGIDFWAWLQKSELLPWIDAKYGSATYLPMRDGALFSVAIGQDGLLARPLNTPAVEAIEQWQ